MSRASMFGLLLLLAPLLQPQLVVFAAARFLGRGRAGALRGSLAAALAWVAAEWGLPKLLGDTLGHGLQASTWLRQGADLAGPAGLTLALLLANEAALVTLRGRARAALAFAAIAAALSGYGAFRLHQGVDAGSTRPLVTAALIQADVRDYAKLREALGSFEAVRAILDTHFELSAEALARGGIDVVVWPETIYPTTFGSPKSDAGAIADRAIAAFARSSGVPLVFGAYDAESGYEYNAAVFLDPQADGSASFETYRKARLFPLTERVPAWLDSAGLRGALPWLGAWRAGPGPEVVPLRLADGRTLRVAPMICYDTLAPEHARAAVRAGAELLLALSNDSWFDGGEGPHLHLIVSAFRSIETRRPQLRATPTGISAAIDASGEITARADVGAREALIASILPGGGGSLALALGDWLGPASALAVVALLALPARSAARAR
jgi:apolipoprotein N-acyltransferase